MLFAGNDKWLNNISKFKDSLKQCKPFAVPFRQRKLWIIIWVVDCRFNRSTSNVLQVNGF